MQKPDTPDPKSPQYKYCLYCAYPLTWSTFGGVGHWLCTNNRKRCSGHFTKEQREFLRAPNAGQVATLTGRIDALRDTIRDFAETLVELFGTQHRGPTIKRQKSPELDEND